MELKSWARVERKDLESIDDWEAVLGGYWQGRQTSGQELQMSAPWAAAIGLADEPFWAPVTWKVVVVRGF